MARWYFMLVAFSSEDSAAVAERSYARLEINLHDIGPISCNTSWSRRQSKDGFWWISVEPRGVSIGVGVPPVLTSRSQLDEIAGALYGHLAEIEGFHRALVGWEINECFMDDDSDVVVEVPLKELGICPGLVITTAAWERAGAPDIFQPFLPGYVWQPYKSCGISGW